MSLNRYVAREHRSLQSTILMEQCHSSCTKVHNLDSKTKHVPT